MIVSACGGVVDEVSGHLLPPLPPYNASGYFCEWKLRPPESMIDPHNRTGITLTVTVSGSLGNFDRSTVCVQRMRKQKYIEMNGQWSTNDTLIFMSKLMRVMNNNQFTY